MMSKYINRLLGTYPVFGKEAGHNQVHNLKGLPYNQEEWDTVTRDTLSYEGGLLYNKAGQCFKADDVVTPEKLNALFNFITTSIGYLYQQGVAQYTLDYKYPKDAVVVYKGNLYISKEDNNIKHPTVLGKYWEQLTNVEPVVKVQDTNPIGTILTVPTSVEKEGYINYVEGSNFNRNLYPDLFVALGTDTFGSVNSGNTDLPVGSIIHYLGSDLPEGYITFGSSIINYPELKQVINRMISLMPLGDSRTIWEQAYKQNMLPNLDNVFLQVSNYENGITGSASNGMAFNILPVMVENSNSLNPLGYRRTSALAVTSPLQGVVSKDSSLKTNVVLVGHLTEAYGNTEVPMVQVGDESNTSIKPAHLSTKVLIKAKSIIQGVPSTHKQIIKAFEVNNVN